VATSKPRKEPGEELMQAVKKLATVAAQRATSSAVTKLAGSAGRLTEKVQSTGSGQAKAVRERTTDRVSKSHEGKNGTSKESDGTMRSKSTNVIEEIEIGVAPDVAYEQWTTFSGEHGMLANAEPVDEEPGVKMVWHAQNGKSISDGAVTFHELAPDLTRVTMVMEKEPHGLKARVGKMLGAPGRQVRHELEDYRRFVLAETLLHQDNGQAEEPEPEEPEAEEPEMAAEEEEPAPKPRARRTSTSTSSKSSSGSTRARSASAAGGSGTRRSAKA